MFDYIDIDESLVRHAWSMGWIQPKTQASLDYFLSLIPELNNPNSTNPDVRNFKKAVANGIARSAAGVSEARVKEIVAATRLDPR